MRLGIDIALEPANGCLCVGSPMKHFLNSELMAPNVLRIKLDGAMIRERLPVPREEIDPRRFSISSPPWSSDIRWISAASVEAFEEFQSLFDSLGIAASVEPYLDLDAAVRLYCGFLIERSVCESCDFHVDWLNTNNEAFTLLTPVSDNCRGFGMLYKKIDGTIGEYEYTLGEGLIIGDHFVHSTRPGRSIDPVVLLSFTFGTDKMNHWDNIARTATRQGSLVRLPNGAFLSSSR